MTIIALVCVRVKRKKLAFQNADSILSVCEFRENIFLSFVFKLIAGAGFRLMTTDGLCFEKRLMLTHPAFISKNWTLAARN
jgi:hypothetical protein